jgi:UDP:flavonoid glycosyltransferase YjiC (YdhE family)
MAARALFVTWDGGGNVVPLLDLGPRLVRDGWDVEVHGPPSLAERFGEGGVAFSPREVGDPWDVTRMALDVRQLCRRTAPDVVVVDYMMPGALVGALAAGRPTVALVHTLYQALLVDGAPAPMSMAATVADVDRACRRVGVPEVISLGGLLSRCERVLVTCPLELDVPSDGPQAPNVRYVGPQLEVPSLVDQPPAAVASAAVGAFEPGPAGVDPQAFGTPLPAASDHGRHVVVVSMGTTPMDEQPVLETVLAALADLPVDVVATVGAHLDPARVAAPANATVCAYVPHAELLPGASLVISHGGLGTVLAGLAHGLPQVCLPLGRDQPDNAAAVERIDAGRSIEPTAGADKIRDVVAEVLGAAHHRAAARALAADIAALEGLAQAELGGLAGLAGASPDSAEPPPDGWAGPDGWAASGPESRA